MHHFSVKRLLALCMAVCLLLAGCGAKGSDTGTIRVGALKGPTSMGLLFLMEDNEAKKSANDYEFQMTAAADELLLAMAKGDIDIALIPANAASVLYNKTDKGICVIDINTLGVLHLVTGDSTIQSLQDLAGRTIYLTGKGTTPDYCLNYLLTANSLAPDDYTLEFKAEATEVAALLAQDPTAVGLLPQPFVTSACMQNEALAPVISLNDEWIAATGQDMVTGVTVVRREFYDKHKKAVEAFEKEHADSVKRILEDPEEGALLCVKQGILPKEPVARKAIPACSLSCITGEEMESALGAYLQILFDKDPQSVGGALPDDDFFP